MCSLQKLYSQFKQESIARSRSLFRRVFQLSPGLLGGLGFLSDIDIWFTELLNMHKPKGHHYYQHKYYYQFCTKCIAWCSPGFPCCASSSVTNLPFPCLNPAQLLLAALLCLAICCRGRQARVMKSGHYPSPILFPRKMSEQSKGYIHIGHCV